ARAWTWSRITELFLIHFRFIAAGCFEGLVILIARDHRPVMLQNEIIDAARQAVFVRQRDSFVDVAYDDLSRFVWGKILVRIQLVLLLVLDEEHGVHCLS